MVSTESLLLPFLLLELSNKLSLESLEAQIEKLNAIIEKNKEMKGESYIFDLKKFEANIKSEVLKELHEGDDSDEINRKIAFMQK